MEPGYARIRDPKLPVGKAVRFPENNPSVLFSQDVPGKVSALDCEVHERFTPQDIRELRDANPGVVVLAHPECPPEVVAEADFAGSTAAMAGYVGERNPARVVLVTECSISDNVSLRRPDI